MLLLIFAQIVFLQTLQTESLIEIEGSLKVYVNEIKRVLTVNYKEVCYNVLCDDEITDNCAVSFSKNESKCFAIEIWPQLLLWNPKSMIKQSGDYVTIFKEQKSIKRPEIFWLFDSVFKGMNLGNGGSALDISVSSPITLTAQGPHPPSSRRYIHYNPTEATKKLKRYVKLFQNGKQLMDFTDDFTFVTWLKTIRNGISFIFENDYRYPDVDKGIDVRLHKNINRMVVRSSGNELDYASTVPNDKNLFGWRHVAITYIKKSQSLKVLLNGQNWPFERKMKKNFVNPKILYFFQDARYAFAGSFACMGFFQHHLSTSEVQAIMKGCP